MWRSEVVFLLAEVGSASVSGAREMNTLGSSLHALLTGAATRRCDTLDFEFSAGFAGAAKLR
jgi:hypothetical protein